VQFGTRPVWGGELEGLIDWHQPGRRYGEGLENARF
jgi:hypothetical protein